MADLDSIQQRLDALIQGRYQDREEVLRALHEVKGEVVNVRLEIAQAMVALGEKIDKNYVRKDVNDEKDRHHDEKLKELSEGLTTSKTEQTGLRTRIDRFAIAGGTVAATVAIFKQDIAAFIRLLIP